MSFWNLSDNNPIEKSGSFELGGGTVEPIPAKTQVLFAPDEVKWDSYDGEEYISIRWNVLMPKEYANRKIFQKLKVKETDSKKRDKALRMLAAIDTNAGGKLMAAGKEPNDQELTVALINKPMLGLLQVWEIEQDDGTKKRGNWIGAVSPRGNGQPAKAPEVTTQEPAMNNDFDDDIGF